MTTLDVTEADFKAEVLDRSHEVPVVVDFWASWCAPCRALGPVLEKLADEAAGDWVLARVDVDAAPDLAAAAQVQGIPAVKAFRNGRLVAEFTGALPEAQVRSWLAELGPSPADIAFEEARGLEEAGDPSGALAAYREVLNHDPGHDGAKSAVARLELAMRSHEVDEQALRARLEGDPADVDAATELADALASSGRLEEAFDLLVRTVSLTSGESRDRARRRLLGLMDMVPAEDPRVVAARRSLSLVLF